jgi:hypothetical protein
MLVIMSAATNELKQKPSFIRFGSFFLERIPMGPDRVVWQVFGRRSPVFGHHSVRSLL